MKSLFTILLLVVITNAMSQTQRVKDTLFLNGNKFIKGQLLTIGEGSNSETKGYNYLFAYITRVPQKLASGWNNFKMKIIGFEHKGNDTMGYKDYLILNDGNKGLKYLCDIENAIKAGEILLPGN